MNPTTSNYLKLHDDLMGKSTQHAVSEQFLDMPTLEEINRYNLKYWYEYMPVAIQIRPVDEEGKRFYVDRHYPQDKGFQTPRDRMEWKENFKEMEECTCIILEDGQEWVNEVIPYLIDALSSWANDHYSRAHSEEL